MLLRLNLVEVKERSVADVFVVLNPAAPGDRNKAIASMVGGLLCTPGFLLAQDGAGATAVQLVRGLLPPRFIFVSEGTVTKHKPMVELLRRVCTQQAHACGAATQRWHWFNDAPDQRLRFLERGRARGKAHASEMVTLVVPRERLPNCPRQMDLRAFIDSIHRVNKRFTHMGYCQR